MPPFLVYFPPFWEPTEITWKERITSTEQDYTQHNYSITFFCFVNFSVSMPITAEQLAPTCFVGKFFKNSFFLILFYITGFKLTLRAFYCYKTVDQLTYATSKFPRDKIIRQYHNAFFFFLGWGSRLFGRFGFSLRRPILHSLRRRPGPPWRTSEARMGWDVS